MNTNTVGISTIVERVVFVQSVVPEYRVAFFNGLDEKLKNKNCTLQVYTARTRLGYPNTVKEHYQWLNKDCEFLTIFNKQLPWQRKLLRIPMSKNTILFVSGDKKCIVSTIYLIIKARIKGSKLIWFGHLNYKGKFHTGFHFRRLLMNKCNEILFYTQTEVDQYQYHFPKRKNAHCTNNSVDTSFIVKKTQERIIQAKWDDKGSIENPLKIGYIGRLTERSKVCYIPKIAKQCTTDGLNITFTLIGEGESRGELEKEIQKYGYENIIALNGKITNQDEIYDHLKECDVFIYPGKIGLSILHAMAMGLPCILSNNRDGQGPEYDYAKNKINAILCNIDDAAIASKAIGYLASGKTREQMSKSALETAKKYSISNMVDSVMKLI